MSKILVTYATQSGSTAEIAQTIGNTLEASAHVDVREHSRVGATLTGYSAVVVGGPILRNECHIDTLMFVHKHRDRLSEIPVAFFFPCLIITRTEELKPVFPILIDPALQKTKSKEKTHSLRSYLKPIAEEAPHVRPVAIAFLKGRMHIAKLDFGDQILIRLITLLSPDINEGDFINHDLIRQWASDIRPLLVKGPAMLSAR